MPDNWKNKLYFGDNLGILREHVDDGSVDLIYLDPPFNSNASYNVLFQEKSGKKSAAQITAFEDTWQWGMESEEAFHDIVTSGRRKVADLMQALRSFLGQSDMMAYLAMMTPRLVELHRTLKPTGSLYLHCDPTASHYLKIVLDGVFEKGGFRNEIIWQRTNAHNMRTKGYVRANDTIFFYTKTDQFTFNAQYTEYGIEQLRRFKPDETGRLYKAENMTFSNPNPNRQFEWRGAQPPPNRSWGASLEQLEKWYAEGRILLKRDGTPRLDGLKIYLDETKGKPLTTNWTDIDRVSNTSGERLGYPTQKPEALLERIIHVNSNEGDVILDPFCGCGTAIAVAERLHRCWIGIDVTHLAITLIRHRLQDAFQSELSPYEIIGAPTDTPGAEALAQVDRYQFQWWALGLIGAMPAQDKKKGADSGIDGFINFFEEKSEKARKIVVQVKSGHVKVSDIRDLKGTMEREKAAIGAFITLETPTKPMLTEAAAAGFYESQWFAGQQFPRLQVLTIEELLNGMTLKYPRLHVETFKRAERQSKSKTKQEKLF